MLEIKRFFFGMSSDVTTFKVHVFLGDFVFLNQSKWILVVVIPIQILLTIFLSIDHCSSCKLKVYMITHTKRNHLQQIDIFHKIGKAMKIKSKQKLS